MKAPKPKQIRGFGLIDVLFILLIVVFVWVKLIVPRLVNSNRHAPKNTCIANLKQIDGAKEQWALDHEKPKGAPADSVAINSYLKNSQPLICPTKGVYTYNPVGSNPTCSRGPTQGHTL